MHPTTPETNHTSSDSSPPRINNEFGRFSSRPSIHVLSVLARMMIHPVRNSHPPSQQPGINYPISKQSRVDSMRRFWQLGYHDMLENIIVLHPAFFHLASTMPPPRARILSNSGYLILPPEPDAQKLWRTAWTRYLADNTAIDLNYAALFTHGIAVDIV